MSCEMPMDGQREPALRVEWRRAPQANGWTDRGQNDRGRTDRGRTDRGRTDHIEFPPGQLLDAGLRGPTVASGTGLDTFTPGSAMDEQPVRTTVRPCSRPPCRRRDRCGGLLRRTSASITHPPTLDRQSYRLVVAVTSFFMVRVGCRPPVDGTSQLPSSDAVLPGDCRRHHDEPRGRSEMIELQPVVFLVGIVNGIAGRVGLPALILLVVAGAAVRRRAGLSGQSRTGAVGAAPAAAVRGAAAVVGHRDPACCAPSPAAGHRHGAGDGLCRGVRAAAGDARNTVRRRPRARLIVAPPDAVAAVAVARRAGLPRQVVTVLEGESLFNDATSLVLLKVAVTSWWAPWNGEGSFGGYHRRPVDWLGDRPAGLGRLQVHRVIPADHRVVPGHAVPGLPTRRAGRGFRGAGRRGGRSGVGFPIADGPAARGPADPRGPPGTRCNTCWRGRSSR